MTEDRLAALERRVSVLEDTAAIYRLMATFGPAADSNSLVEVSELWTHDGVYDLERGRVVGREEIVRALSGRRHQTNLAAGIAHHVSAPRVSVSGDTATAIAYQSNIVRSESGEHVIRRQSANLWEFVRTPDGWRVSSRTNRQLDGSSDGKDLLRRGLRQADL